MKLRVARAFAFLFRFSGLRVADWLARGLGSPSWTSRRMFGGWQPLELSRCGPERMIFLEGERFVDERFLLRRILKPGMTTVDVGANIGYYLLLLKQCCGASSKAICIEPSEENLPELKRCIAENKFDRVDLHEVALGDHEGDVGLRTGINSGVVESAQGGAYTVPLRRLDAVVQDRVDFIKIDVEGYEGQVLAGSEGLLARKPVLFLELHPHIVGRFGYSVRGILDKLSSYYQNVRVYEKTPIAEQGLWFKIATRYLGRDPLREVTDIDAYVERYDGSRVEHTFWAVFEP